MVDTAVEYVLFPPTVDLRLPSYGIVTVDVDAMGTPSGVRIYQCTSFVLTFITFVSYSQVLAPATQSNGTSTASTPPLLRAHPAFWRT